ncbi:hypothetical protein NDU88_002945 [Pleurodeles waltl]|uniref:Uncharacterized protein n=1 Tax=Pleurodeles waltl TaxID=8319 RepID=A0AAV7Q8J9_PLEWA|nr:hypothetical protein NDU88_002945 [Pleurodeles waltl]
MRMRVFHFNGRIARGTTDCGRSSSTALQTRRSGATPSLRHPQALHQKVQACTHHGRSTGSYQNVLRLCD